MIERLNSIDSIKQAAASIQDLIAAREEWIYARDGSGRASALRKSEIDFRIAQGRLMFSCLSDEGHAVWHVTAWEWNGEKLLLEATRRMGAERAQLELIPRASAGSIAALVAATRRARCQTLAQLACAVWHGARIARAGLSAGARLGQPGRDARILLDLRNERIAVTGTVAEDDGRGVDAFLSSALIWFTRACEKRTRPPYITKLCLVAREQSIEALAQRIALLRDELRRIIALFEIDEEWQVLKPVRQLERRELWIEPPKRLHRPAETEISKAAVSIISLAPEAIDVVRARHGETLRFHGLAFARVRCVMNRPKIWFGVEGAQRRLLDGDTAQEWDKLLRDLQEHRRAATDDYQHALYRAAPEAWLESLLRRDVTRLDPGLRLAPLHAQFRASSTATGHARNVDLLALRRDGRLAVIELKVSEDREHVLQGIDYWRRVEAQRLSGNLTRARLFDDAAISDEPPLVYLVAPLLRFHRAFHTLARSVAPDIQIYRFDLNEAWRAGVRVMRRVVI